MLSHCSCSFPRWSPHKCMCEDMEESILSLGTEDLFQWEKTHFPELEGQCRLIRGDNQPIFKWSKTPRSHLESLMIKPRLSSCAGPFIFPRWSECCHSAWDTMKNSQFNGCSINPSSARSSPCGCCLTWQMEGAPSINAASWFSFNKAGGVSSSVYKPPAPRFKSFLTKGSLNACIDSWLRNVANTYVEIFQSSLKDLKCF